MANGSLTPQERIELQELRRLDELERKYSKFNTKEEPISNESSPDVSVADRLITKNLANSPEAVMGYFGENHPDLESRNYGGEIQVRKKGDSEWRKLDANNGYFDTLKGVASLTPQGMLLNKLVNGEWVNPQGKETLADAGDLASDVVGGAVTGAAMKAGPIAAGGAAAATEALRQKLGQYFGIPQDVNMKEVALQGGLNTALPVIGKGASAGWNVVKSDLAPWVGSHVTGIRSDIIKALPDKLDKIEKMTGEGILSFGEKTAKKVAHAVNRAQTKAMNLYDQVLDRMPGTVDVKGGMKVLDDYVDEAAAAYERVPNADNKKALNDAIAIRDKFFKDSSGKTETKLSLGDDGIITKSEAPATLDTKLRPRDALEVTKRLRDEGNLRKMADVGPFRTGELPYDRPLAEARTKINVAMDKANPEFQKARSTWTNLQDQKEIADDIFGNDRDVYKKLLGLGRKTNAGQYEQAMRLDKAYPEAGIKNAIEDAQLHYYFGEPANQAISIGGSTSTSRTLPLTLAGRDLGQTMGSAMGSSVAADALGTAGGFIGSTLGSPATVKNTIKASRWFENLIKQDPEFAKALIYGGTQEVGKSPWENFR
jgi:hypothetical protein